MTRIALYARYSSDNQSIASIEDQFRICREQATREAWQVVGTYHDAAISGASVILRPGVQALLQDAQRGRFEIVLAEALDRVSRDQADVAMLFKHLRFAGVRIVTLSEGEITELHVGLKGTMNALFLKDLAAKTHRGIRGRVEQGKSGGGLCYGYDVVRQPTASVEAPRGDRTINPAEATIISRIFEEYAVGKSPKRIAADLNREGIKAPSGGDWGSSTVNGNRQRGTGILNNELYVGRLVWNRLRYIKDPATGKRVSRLNPEGEWISQDVPDLRIVGQDLWDRVKTRQKAITPDSAEGTPNRLHERVRGRYLFSGLTKCACCGGGYSMISSTHIGCSTARNKGTCDNRLNIRRDELEARVLNALKGHLMDPALFKEFCDEFTRQMNRRRMEARAGIDAARSELRRIEREFETLMHALLKGTLPEERIKARSDQLEHRKVQVEASLAAAEEPPPVLHPSMAVIYRERVSGLYEALQQEGARVAASDVIRSLVSEIILTPSAGELLVDLRGDLGCEQAKARQSFDCRAWLAGARIVGCGDRI